MRINQHINYDAFNEALSMQTSGNNPRLFSSRKTLFGIPSSLDEELLRLESMPPISNSHNNKEAKTSSKSSVHRVVHPLEPIYDEKSTVLMLGTMPSPKSREVGMYYGHPQNRFWKVMAALFDEPFPEDNNAKRQLALRHGIALWDVLSECEIEGAQDGTIAACVPNCIAQITRKAPIKSIFCTGSKAAELYKKYCEPETGLSAIKLPSTSSANATTSLEELITAYSIVLSCVQ